MWLHKITRYLGHTSLFIFKLHMTRIFFLIFILHESLAKLVNIVRFAKLHNKISFRRDQISNFSSVYGFLFHSSGYFFETLLKQCKAKKCFFDVIIRKKKTIIHGFICWIKNCQGYRKIQCAWFFTHLNLSYESLMLVRCCWNKFRHKITCFFISNGRFGRETVGQLYYFLQTWTLTITYLAHCIWYEDDHVISKYIFVK